MRAPLVLACVCLLFPPTVAISAGLAPSGADTVRVDAGFAPFGATTVAVAAGSASSGADTARVTVGLAPGGADADSLPAFTPQGLAVTVPLPPLRWLVSGIAGESVEIGLLVPPGASAEDYDPSPRDLRRFARASLFFTLDTPVERRWLPRLRHLNAGLKIVPLPLPLPHLDWSGQRLPTSAPGRPSDDPELDFHGWNSPAVLATWIDPVVQALSVAVPARAADFAGRGARMRTVLEALDRELAALLAPHRGRSFLTLHPAWGYFAERYGLRQLALEDRGREPGPRTLARILAEARSANIQQIFVPPRAGDEFVRRAAGTLVAEVIELDELAEDYPATLRRFAQQLARGFEA